MSDYAALAGMLQIQPMALAMPDRDRVRSQFSAPLSSTLSVLRRELENLGADRGVLELDMAAEHLRLDGLPRSGAIARSPGIIVSFRVTGFALVSALRYEIDAFDHWADNLRGLALGLEALRAVDRYGVTKRGEQYVGFKALTAGTSGDGDPARGRGLINAAGGSWRKAAALAHPDTGGNPDDFRDVIAARDAGA